MKQYQTAVALVILSALTYTGCFIGDTARPSESFTKMELAGTYVSCVDSTEYYVIELDNGYSASHFVDSLQHEVLEAGQWELDQHDKSGYSEVNFDVDSGRAPSGYYRIYFYVDSIVLPVDSGYRVVSRDKFSGRYGSVIFKKRLGRQYLLIHPYELWFDKIEDSTIERE